MPRLTPEQEEFRRSVAKLVETEIAPVADDIDARGELPPALFRRLGTLGYFGLRYPERYGGSEADMVTFCLLAEELGRGSMSLAAAAMMQALMGTHFVFKYGSEEQRQRYLVPALRGERIGAFALTEPGAGSDLGNMQTRARRDGDHWVLRGAKTWVTSAPIADFVTVGAKTSDERGLRHIALFLVDPKTMPGVVQGKRIAKMSVRASDTGEIALEDVRVPASHLLGGESGGVEKIGAILSEIRGRARPPVTREAAMAKLTASETAVRVADEAARIFASYSLATEYPVQRYLRDSRFLLFGGGTSEILRMIISRDL